MLTEWKYMEEEINNRMCTWTIPVSWSERICIYLGEIDDHCQRWSQQYNYIDSEPETLINFNKMWRLQENLQEKRTFEEPHLLPTCINVMYAHIDM